MSQSEESTQSEKISLSRFLCGDGTQLRIFDVGRRVSKISQQQFEKFEQAELAYPYPFQQTAWMALLFWQKNDKTQHNIWFIRMPLDETGCIQLSARDEFMHLLLSRIGEHITQKDNADDLTHALKDNPYVFKPAQENMAVFHSKAQQLLNQTVSQHFAPAISYLKSDELQNWRHLGVQGFADVATQQDKNDINQILCNKLILLPDESFSALCYALENEILSTALAGKITDYVKVLIQKEQAQSANVNESSTLRIISCLRAISNIKSEQLKNAAIQFVLESHYGNQANILVIIIGKNWESLRHDALLQLYLEKLAQNTHGQKLFDALIADLIFIPGMRDKIMQAFRIPDRSETLSVAVGQFFNNMSTTP